MEEKKCFADIGTIDWEAPLHIQVHQMRHMITNGMEEGLWMIDPERQIGQLGLDQRGIKARMDMILMVGLKIMFHKVDSETIERVAQLALCSMFLDILAAQMAELIPEQYAILVGNGPIHHGAADQKGSNN